jgi:hypothetical protein
MFFVAYKKTIKYKEQIEFQKVRNSEELEKNKAPFMESPKQKKGCRLFFIIAMIFMVIIIVLTIIFPSTKTNKVAIAKVNIDSLVNAVKKDSSFGIGDVYYNPEDSSFNIAITNKYNVIKEGDYSTAYFNNTYHIDSFPCFEGVYLYAYKKGKSLKKGDYKEYLTCDSKRAAVLYDTFEKKYCYGNHCTPLEEYLKETLNDPDSYKSDKLWVNWKEGNSFDVTNSFRAKNAFGAMVFNKCSAVIDIDGNVSDFQIDN